MIATCEKCRKKYEIDPEKFEGEVSRFRCTSCGNVITVSKSKAKTLSPPPVRRRHGCRAEERAWPAAACVVCSD